MVYLLNKKKFLELLGSLFDVKIIFWLVSCRKTIDHWYNINISRFT